MRRFVTYVYIYDKGEKQKNTGFIKVDVADDVFKLDIRIQNIGRYNGRCPIYVIVGENNIVGIKIGELDIRRGSGNGQYILEKNNIKNSGYTLDDVAGVRVDISENTLLASCWREEMSSMIAESFVLWTEKKPEIISAPETSEGNQREEMGMKMPKENQNEEADVKMPEENQNEESEMVMSEELSGEETGNVSKEVCSGIKKIDITDIKSLPKKNWYLCNNSFLLHGFFVYHYLVIKEKVENGNRKYYLGVPGVFERPEKAMALLFGFPEFEAENSNQPEPIGEFGYWYCLLDM